MVLDNFQWLRTLTVGCLLGGWLPAWGAGLNMNDIDRLIEIGNWRQATAAIERQLERPDLAFPQRANLRFQQERMARIRLDFYKTKAQVLHEAQQILPGLAPAMFDQWEKAGAVESFNIDGERWYFERAAGNLFRIQPPAQALLAARQSDVSPVPQHRLANLREILHRYDETGKTANTPQQWHVIYTLTVKPDAVPAGETIRAWLPFPQTGGRQTQVQLLTSDPPVFVRSPEDRALASIYLEKMARAGQPTGFQIEFEYRTMGFHQPVDPQRVQALPANSPAAKYLVERPPHIVFDESLCALSREIVAGETNAYRIARRIFQWVHTNIPWAGAREYSTLNSLPQYALEHRHGDCGIQTMLFISLCRLNGIPARWESGWTTGPDRNMHDWCAVYLEPYGWLPVDVSYGLVPSNDEREKWFFLGGIDSYRLVVNTDYEQPLYPAKMHFRSEIVDFQRGEVEWRGGNLYFNQWTYNFHVEDMTPQSLDQATDTSHSP